MYFIYLSLFKYEGGWRCTNKLYIRLHEINSFCNSLYSNELSKALKLINFFHFLVIVVGGGSGSGIGGGCVCICMCVLEHVYLHEHSCMHTCTHTCTFNGKQMMVRGQLCGIHSLFSFL